MNKAFRLVSIFALAAILASCSTLTQIATTVLETPQPLTSADVARGLKEALKIGTDTAVTRLNKMDGYLLDPLVKINLPPQTDNVIQYARKVPGLDKLINDVVVQINRSAEDAAVKALPIFKNAVTSMTIDDAWGILRGPNNAATSYLNQKTYSQLTSMFKPSISESLGKPLVAGVSASTSWNEITSKWNKFANSVAGKLVEAKPINVSLDEYVTAKALDGLFFKVEGQEKQIRTNINARVNDTLKRVFAELDKK